MHRDTHDSGHGSESQSSRSNSRAGTHEGKEESYLSGHQLRDDQVEGVGSRLLDLITMDRLVSCISHLTPNQLIRTVHVFYDAADVPVLMVGFVLVLTGFVTYAGVSKFSSNTAPKRPFQESLAS